jgi:Arrestin (or S-antigen), C-terminal domain
MNSLLRFALKARGEWQEFDSLLLAELFRRGFFRRSKSSVLSTASQIVIDKHELHSTWPIYSQPETRHVTQDGITLSVDRSQTCYGPGDRIFLTATLKSDSLHTVILRGFEFFLKETTVFRAGLQTTSKKGAPQVKISIVADQKLPMNSTLYGGTQSKTELSCTVPSFHTSATINAARHIDITYTLNVKALMGTGMPVAMELPVIVSNWPR